MKKTLLENNYIRSWNEEGTPVIFSLLLKQPESSIMLQQFCDLQEQFVKDLKQKFPGGVYSVCDASVMQPFEFEIMVNYYAHIFPKQQRAGLLYKAFVIPKNYDLDEDFGAVLKKVNGRSIGIFQTIEKANLFIRELTMKAVAL